MTGHSHPTILRSALLDELAWLEHGFGTRHTGIPAPGTPPLLNAIDQTRMASLKQIHSGITLIADRLAGECGEADALVTAEPGVTVSIRTADCVPILFADPETHAVAAIHAGWRGTAERISRSALQKMRDEFGVRAETLIAAIGPAIGACCYEVSAEVAGKVGVDFEEASNGTIDLVAINRAQLIDLGIAAEHIDIVGTCTKCDPRTYFSHRGEGQRAGRMVSFIGRL